MKNMGESKEIHGQHEFNVQRLVEVKPSVVRAAKRAISMVWKKHVGQPESFDIVFASKIYNPKTGEDTGWSVEYNPDEDKFSFAMDTIKERMEFGLPDDGTILLLSAHEATHKVQFQRGDPPRPSPKTKEMDEYYDDNKHEAEAWKEAAHVIKAVYPNSSGGFTVGKRRFVIPILSKYSGENRFHLNGYYQGGHEETGYGDCVKSALSDAGYEVDNIPEWIRAEDMGQLCKELGLIWHGGEKQTITIDKNQPVIAVYGTRSKLAHAEFVDDLGPLLTLHQLLEREFVGIIEFPSNTTLK